MKTTYKYSLLTALVLMLSMQACKKDFLDVNENPNNPEDVPMNAILPAAQGAVAYTLGNQLHIVGGLWGQYWTQGANASQYNSYEQYAWNNTDSDRPWSQLYAQALKDIDVLRKKAIAENNPNYEAIADFMQAYTMQVVTDAWGDVPFTQALQADAGITRPVYDTQESIYDSIIGLIDHGILILGNSDEVPGVDDLFYHGDLFLWYKFANTLKLRIYLRQVYRRPSVSSEGIGALTADPTEFLESGEDALMYFKDEQFRQNPLYTTIQALGFAKNIFASKTSVDTLLALNDPRVADFYDTTQAGLYVGIQQGAAKDPGLFPPPVTDANYSEYDAQQIIAPTVPVRLMSAVESMFLQAEAIARGYMAGDAQTMYELAIEESWLQWSGSSVAYDTAFATYLAHPDVTYPTGGSVEDQVKAIITQKWIAMNGTQNFEAWTEWRRTGYPANTFEISVVAGGTEFPARLVYPAEELTTNGANVPSSTVFTKVWWDVN